MWKVTAGRDIKIDQEQENDDWETDPDFVNDISGNKLAKNKKFHIAIPISISKIFITKISQRKSRGGAKMVVMLVQ